MNWFSLLLSLFVGALFGNFLNYMETPLSIGIPAIIAFALLWGWIICPWIESWFY